MDSDTLVMAGADSKIKMWKIKDYLTQKIKNDTVMRRQVKIAPSNELNRNKNKKDKIHCLILSKCNSSIYIGTDNGCILNYIITKNEGYFEEIYQEEHFSAYICIDGCIACDNTELLVLGHCKGTITMLLVDDSNSTSNCIFLIIN